MQKVKINNKVYQYPYQNVLMNIEDHKKLKVMCAMENLTIPKMLNKLLEQYSNETSSK